MKLWRDKGVLDCDEGHLTIKRKIDVNGDKERVYVIQLWGELPVVNSQGKSKVLKLSQKIAGDIVRESEDNADAV